MELIVVGIIVAFAIAFIVQGLRIVRQSETMIIERWGKYHRTLAPGINLIIPIMDQPRAITMLRYRGAEAYISTERRIDLREVVLDFPEQPVVTSDNVAVRVNGVLYYQVMDPKKALYATENLVLSVQTLAQTTLRSVVGKMELDHILSNREQINAELQGILDEAGDKWGVKVNRTEIRDITIPEDVQRAMNQQMAAERDRRAAIARAEGDKRSEILKAEGDREAAIARAEGEKRASVLNAEGERQAAILRAEGEAQAIQNVLRGMGEQARAEEAVRYLIAQAYMQTLPQIAKDGDRVFLPLESTALMGSLGGVRELLGAAGAGVSNSR